MIGGKREAAHRVAYTLKQGDIPEDKELDHLCRVRCCINPDHLEAVSRSVNVRRSTNASVLRIRNQSPKMRSVVAERNRSAEMLAVVSRPKSPEHAANIRAMLTERNRSPEMRAISARPKSAAHMEAIRQAKLAKRGKQ
jgi:hypothetical protein